jgi:hypothetical protein
VSIPEDVGPNETFTYIGPKCLLIQSEPIKSLKSIMEPSNFQCSAILLIYKEQLVHTNFASQSQRTAGSEFFSFFWAKRKIRMKETVCLLVS